jgi:hypothetical protein
VPQGKFHSGCSNYPPSFARIKITQKSKKEEKAEDKLLDKNETHIPDDDTGITEDELNRLLYQHAQMDQIQLLENIKDNKLDAQAELEKYIRENLSHTPDGRIIAKLPKRDNFRSMVSKNTWTGSTRIKSVQRLLEL